MMQNQSVNIVEVRVEKLLRTNSHVDGGWFWSKYSANPYLGCRYGCAYCFLRQRSYGLTLEADSQNSPADSFSTNIQVRINAAEVLDRELAAVPPDVIIVGDYQPIDNRYRISRQLLQVCLEHGFPVMVISKSPAVLQDLDLIKKISEKSWACVVFSIAFSASGEHQRILEPFAASIESRFGAMQTLSRAGIYTGTAMMPIMPAINDDDSNLRAIIAQTRAQGGQFVLAGGLVLGDDLESQFYQTLQKVDQNLVAHYKQLYQDRFAPEDNSWRELGCKVRTWCHESNIACRIKRYIGPSPLAGNKKLAEDLFLKVYEMELAGSDNFEIQKMRKLAWQVDENQTLLSEQG